jgi:hypothetical protein
MLPSPYQDAPLNTQFSLDNSAYQDTHDKFCPHVDVKSFARNSLCLVENLRFLATIVFSSFDLNRINT